ncbi:MAG: dipeptidase [Planctomycetota bacterium]|nr:dipeptidase [Planctomycetota bacterium]
MDQVEQYLAENAEQFVEDLKSLLRIQSVSADSAFAAEMTKAAEFVRDQLLTAGLSAEIIPTAGHSIVYGEWLGAADAPTALIYGHYDVQPPDPLDEWDSQPFEPDIRNGRIYARGATDDKGQMLTHVKSVQAWMKTHGRLPVNVKFVIEGEEEVGSDNLDKFLAANQDKLKADIAVVSDTSQYAPDIPAITYGLKGIVACEITLRGPNQDLHSGMFGGSVANPANALAALLGGLIDADGRITVSEFYDDVVDLTEQERAAFAALPFSETAFKNSLGVADVFGESGFSTIERRWARPTCDVNGMISGYTGEGPKTIIPSWASAKISCRLVPDQNPRKVVQALEDHLRAHLRPGLAMEFKTYHGADPLVIDTESAFMNSARNAIEKSFGVAPVMIREGGSIPVVASFKRILGVDTLLLGWGQNTDNLHSPNEHFSLKDYQRGIRASAHLWNELA